MTTGSRFLLVLLCLAGLLLAPVMVVLAVILLPVLLLWYLVSSLVSTIRNQLSLPRFCHRHEGEAWLLWSSRGWHRFMLNNVLPALPSTVQPLRLSRAGASPAARQILDLLDQQEQPVTARPMLVAVLSGRLRVHSLRPNLVILRPLTGPDPAVQRMVREIVERALHQAARQSGG